MVLEEDRGGAGLAELEAVEEGLSDAEAVVTFEGREEGLAEGAGVGAGGVTGLGRETGSEALSVDPEPESPWIRSGGRGLVPLDMDEIWMG